MTIKEKILNDYIRTEANKMRNNILRNVESDLNFKIKLKYSKDEILKLLDLRDRLRNIYLDEFLEMEFDEDLQNYVYW